MYFLERIFLKALFVVVLLVLLFSAVIFLAESKAVDSCSRPCPFGMTSAFGTAHTKGRVTTVSQQPPTGDMRIVRVHVPPFYSTHSALTSWGAGFNKVQLI